MNYLPSKLNKLRKHYSYSQQYVADRLGVDVVEYMDFENGNKMVTHYHMKKLANLYHISMNDIFKNIDELELPEINTNTNEINSKFFIQENGIKNKIRGFIINHKIASIIIGVLLLAIIILSIVLSNVVKPYTIKRENTNRLSASETTVIYIEDSGAIGFSGSNANGQLNDLAVTSAIKVCEGDGFSIALNEDGSVVSSGLISKYADEIHNWKNIVDIAAGSKHVVGVDSNGRVYCEGDSEACEIAGTRNVKKVFATANGSIVKNNSGTLSYAGAFIGSSYIKDMIDIIDISSSNNILAVLNSNNKLNVYSKSGSFIKSESWDDIVDVACGNDFVAGLNKYGKVNIEIDSDEYIDAVKEWTGIIAIAAGDDYLVGFDGKNIYGIGNPKYNQFAIKEKQKTTLEMVKNIEYNIDFGNIYVQFDGVNNASGYLVKLNVGTGLSKHIDELGIVGFSTENMIEGKTYTISITSEGSGDYKDSDEATLSFVYNKPERKIKIEISNYIGKDKSELENYLVSLDISFRSEAEENVACEEKNNIVTEIKGLEDGVYGEYDLSTKIVTFNYCGADTENDEQ